MFQLTDRKIRKSFGKIKDLVAASPIGLRIMNILRDRLNTHPASLFIEPVNIVKISTIKPIVASCFVLMSDDVQVSNAYRLVSMLVEERLLLSCRRLRQPSFIGTFAADRTMKRLGYRYEIVYLALWLMRSLVANCETGDYLSSLTQLLTEAEAIDLSILEPDEIQALKFYLKTRRTRAVRFLLALIDRLNDWYREPVGDRSCIEARIRSLCEVYDEDSFKRFLEDPVLQVFIVVASYESRLI